MSKDDQVLKWLGSSVGRVLARSARGPGFESLSGHNFFLPCDTDITYMVLLYFQRNKSITRKNRS